MGRKKQKEKRMVEEGGKVGRGKGGQWIGRARDGKGRRQVEKEKVGKGKVERERGI